MERPAAPPPQRASKETIRNVERSAGRLTTAAYRHMEERLPWYRGLSARERSWVGTVVQGGFASFVEWYVQAEQADPSTVDVFSGAPRELTRAISLRQTLDLVRTVFDVVEDHIVELAKPGEEEILRMAVLRYSREVAFAAAQIYAGAAESRGAWDARLESLVVDAVLRGEPDDDVASRAAALGWDGSGPVTVVIGTAPAGNPEHALDRIRAGASRLRVDALLAVQGRRLVVILGGSERAVAAVGSLKNAFGPGPIVLGPTVPTLQGAGLSARAALSGLRAAPGWPAAPRPTLAVDLLPERVLVGDEEARQHLVDRVYRPLAEAEALYQTCTTYLAQGRALEATARALFVHPNTVRYRLGRIAETIGYDVSDAREAYVVQTAIAVGLITAAGLRPARLVPYEPGGPVEPEPLL